MSKEPLSIATDLVTVLQAAKEIGVHFTTVYRWIDTGTISGIKIGGIMFVPKSELERLKTK